jgi:hypothetical protein
MRRKTLFKNFISGEMEWNGQAMVMEMGELCTPILLGVASKNNLMDVYSRMELCTSILLGEASKKI